MRAVLATPAPTSGGVWTHMEDLALGLRDAGHGVTLGLREDAVELQRAAASHGLEWVEFGASAVTDADVWHLHLHNTLDTSAVSALVARRRRRHARVVLTEHLPRTFRTDPALTVDPSIPPGRRKPGAGVAKLVMKRAEFAAAHRVIAVSGASAEFLARRYRLDRRRIDVVYNGVDLPEAPADGRPSDAPLRIVLVGVLTWRKGQDLLLAAAREARRPWSITLVGDGDDRAALTAAAEGLDVTFAGQLADASQVAADADVLVLASRGESFSYVPLEAMALGRPVVAADVDGMDEMIEHGVSGLLVAPEDPQALAAALDELADDRDRARSLGMAARARVAERFRKSTMIERTLRIYEETTQR